MNQNSQQKVQVWGLGLGIVKNIIESHEGSIKCISKIKKGTTFVITLPKKVISEEKQ